MAFIITKKSPYSETVLPATLVEVQALMGRQIDADYLVEYFDESEIDVIKEQRDALSDNKRVVDDRLVTVTRSLQKALDLARQLIDENDIDRTDSVVKALVGLGMDPFVRTVTGTASFTVDVSWCVEVPEEYDEARVADAVGDALNDEISVDLGRHRSICIDGSDEFDVEVDDVSTDFDRCTAE